MKIIAFYSIKGGVGKTAAAVNLAYIAAAEGAKTILLDMDPQGSASYYFRIKSSKKFSSKKFIKGRKRFDKSIKGTDYRNLDLLPSHLSYRNLDLVLDKLKRSKKRLREVLEPFAKEYDFVFLDCPPNITLVSENIFYAADYLLVPLVPTTLSLLTYEKLRQFFTDKALDQSKIFVFFSMVEKRKKMHRGIMEKMSNQDGRFLNSRIPYTADVEKMGIYREPLLCFRPKSIAARSYGDLWAEIKSLEGVKK